MFSPTKLGDSSGNKRKTQLLYSPRPNEFRQISKKSLPFRLTSTPLIMNNRRSNSFGSTSRLKRYSLSDIVATPPKYLNNIETIKSKSVQKTCGPLLASTQYNINLSTYVDSKSPGFAGRIVQYNEERERLKTHQSRYGSPGIFPIVHLSKKDLPIISPKSKRVTIRIASPDCSRNASPDLSRILLAGNATQDNSSNATIQQLNDISTRSVLDALKEISRKRIHPGEEYEVSEDAAKRYRSESFNGMDNQKRIFDEQTTLENNAQAAKKICVVDSYYASVSSYLKKPSELNEPETKEQETRKTTVEPEKRTVATVETQTVPEENPVPVTDSKTTADEVEEDKNEKNNETEQSPADCPKKQHRKAPLRIFDEKPLEILRKNRLAALVGALTGEEPVLLEKEDKLAKFREESEREELEKERLESGKSGASPRKSILMQDNKKSSPEKHVTFLLPESSSSESRPTEYSPLSCFPLITQTSASITTPLMSAGVSDSPNTSMTGGNISTPVAVSAMSTNVSFNFGSENESMRNDTTTGSGGGMSFFSATPVSNSNQADKPVVTLSEPNPPPSSLGSNFGSAFTPVTNSKFQFGFGSSGPITGNGGTSNNEASIGSSTSTAKAQNPDSSPVKAGGFKFDLPMSPVGVSEKTEPAAPSSAMMQDSPKQTDFSYNSTPDRIAFGRGSQNLVSSTTMTNPTMSFGHWNSISGSNQTPTSPKTSSERPDSNTNKPFAFGQAGSFNSPAKTNESGFSVNPPTFGTSMVESGNKTPVFGTISNATLPAAGVQNKLDFSIPVPVNSGTGGTGTGTGASNGTTPFGSSNPGAATTNTLGANAPMFNFSNTSNFGNTTTTSTFSFGNAAAPVSVPAPSFGTATNNSSAFQAAQPNSTPFGVPNMTSGFGAQTTTSSNPVFGNPSLSFPFANNPVSSTNAGAASASVNASAAANMFGAATSSAPSFGSSKPTISFGSSSGGGFGTKATTQPSGITGVSGTTGATTFGAGAGAGSGGFSFGSNAPNSASPGFSSTQSSTFGSTNNMFGNLSKPMFGATTATTTTTNIPSFGSTSTPSFSFGGTTVTTTSSAAPSIFGSSAPAFGTMTTTSNNVFGGTNTTFVSQSGFGGGSAFKPPTSNPVFGSNAAPSFPTTTTAAFQSSSVPSFGSSTSGFGTNTSTANNASGSSAGGAFPTPNFASPAPASSPFAMNSNAFRAGGGGTSGFSVSGNGGFSAKAPPSFGSFTTPQNNAFGSATSSSSGFSAAAPTSNGGFSFGPNTQTTGGFSFGSPEPPKAGFNFSSSAASPPSFSGSFNAGAPPAFGASMPAFNAAPMFSIGSGSAPSKSRILVKGRRRTEK